MPLSIFKIRNVLGGNLIMAPVYAAMIGTFFLLSIYMQNVLGYSPLKSGLSFLPFPIILGLMSTRTPKLVNKYGFRRFLIIGPIIIAVGMALLSRLPVHGTYLANILPTAIIMPFGVALTFMPVIAAATSGVKPTEAGLASGLVSTSQQMGGALGLAILSGVANSVTESNMNLGRAAAEVHGAVGFLAAAAILAAVLITQRKKPVKHEGIGVPVLE
jgi:predicted MFS family arabinose efflux permease